MTKSIKSAFGLGAGKSASKSVGQYNQQAIEEVKRQNRLTEKNVKPYLDGGLQGLEALLSGATLEGFGSNLADIFQSPALTPLIEERTRAIEGQLSAGGLTRSGTAIDEAADIPMDLAMVIEQMLSVRNSNLANTGVNAAIGQGNIGANAAASIASLLNNTGQAKSSGKLADAQSRASLTGQLFSGAAAIFSDPSLKTSVMKKLK